MPKAGPRQEAKLKGLIRYIGDKPCPKGHVGERYVSTGQCVECVKSADQESRKRDPARRLEATRQWRARNAPAHRASVKHWRAENAEHVREYRARQRRANGIPSRAEAAAARRAARDAGLTRFNTGRPCQRGHMADRMVSDGRCYECLKQSNRRRDAANRDAANARTQRWKERNPDKVKAQQARWRKSPQYAAARKRTEARLERRMATWLRVRIYNALKRRTKTGSAVRDLGCSIPELIAHLEGQFQPGMGWDNWGQAWEIDHKRPLADFDLSGREQFLAASHFTNLQPLFTADHQRKTGAENRQRQLARPVAKPRDI